MQMKVLWKVGVSKVVLEKPTVQPLAEWVWNWSLMVCSSVVSCSARACQLPCSIWLMYVGLLRLERVGPGVHWYRESLFCSVCSEPGPV